MRSVELFAGGGGLAIGLDQAGFEPQVIVELNKDACNTLRQNYLTDGEHLLYEGDIKKFDYQQVNEPVALVSGGPPCQPFSLGGSHKAHNDDRDMFPEAVRAIRELQPKAFIFENVKGLLRKTFTEYFEYIILQLQYPSMAKYEGEDWEHHLSRLEQHHTSLHEPELEYKVVYRLLNSADYGVPQKRERVFIVGFRADVDARWSFPEPTHSDEALFWDKWVSGNYWNRHRIPQPNLDDKTLRKVDRLEKKYGMFAPETLPWVTVRDALSNIPDPRTNTEHSFLNHEFKDGARSYPGHTGSYIDEPSKTLKAGAHGVPGGENMIRYEDGSIRYFTVRESARIQTFPDNYVLEGAWGEAMRQLGNAVPVELARKVGASVHEALLRVEQQDRQ
ncbi:Modification methylase HaeIII [Vibrio owensii]|uniref:DNA cytosine methyltransferase n=1 Tax=Vibrio owensii TaxID=696485 RepID=UPI0003A92FA0|nr:DNA cytosine methyltransferase [Vibrio owensii]SUP37474.1 Modification methylase HaeIII [Vibrio owensii]